MKNYSPAVDAYIAKSAPFARPILEKLRRLFHEACPDIEESIKWGKPQFEYKGVLAGMAAFKKHFRFGFWKGKLLKDRHAYFSTCANAAMSMKNISDVSELPADDVMLEYIREAVALNEKGVKLPKKKAVPRPKPKAPDCFLTALRKNKKALAAWEALSPSHQREYVEWVTEAKQEATRDKRIATAIEWLTEGKSRYWKYMKKV